MIYISIHLIHSYVEIDAYMIDVLKVFTYAYADKLGCLMLSNYFFFLSLCTYVDIQKTNPVLFNYGQNGMCVGYSM